jgi:heme oxygenase
MNALLGGALTLADYSRLASQYYFIYQALEEVGEQMTEDPVGKQFVFNQLHRLPSLAKDLDFLIGPQWASEIKPLPATEIYTERIRQIGSEREKVSARRYIAHHYTRYLGDIAGGQVIRRLLERKYGIEQEGALFYRFDQIDSAPSFRDNYRLLLDNAPWDERQRGELVEEAKIAYECNIAVFAELAATTFESERPRLLTPE